MVGTQFLGLIYPYYINPVDAAAALVVTPINDLGAEVLALSEVLKKIDSIRGGRFERNCDEFRLKLMSGSRRGAVLAKTKMAAQILEVSPKHWEQVLEQIQAVGWAMSAGLFTTPQVSVDRLDKINVASNILSSNVTFHGPLSPEDVKEIVASVTSLDWLYKILEGIGDFSVWLAAKFGFR